MYIIVAASILLVISGCLGEDTKTPKIAAIKPNELSNYIGQKVAINLAPSAVLSEDTYSYYYKESTLIAGKIPSTQKTSIHRDYKVYDTKEGVKLATGKATMLGAEKNITAIGTVKEDGYTPGNLIIYMEEIITVIEPNGEI